MSKVLLSYEIPFVDQLVLPARWARWLVSNSDKCRFTVSPEQKDPVQWSYRADGWLPWMQFFYEWRFADLVGDGCIGLLQTSGAYRQTARHQDGTVLWSYTDPEASFLDIRYDSMFPVGDVDGDGRTELVCARRIGGVLHLCLVDAGTGRLLRSTPFPLAKDNRDGNYCAIKLVRSARSPGTREILVNWNCRSVVLMDSGLELLWSRSNEELTGRGHSVIAHTSYMGDIDADGHDEILVGSCLFDQDGTARWVAPDLSALTRDGHADSVFIGPLSRGGPPRMLMSTGAYCFDDTGALVWGDDDLKHGQALRVGRLRGDTTDCQVVVYEGASRVDPSLADTIRVYSANGALLWRFDLRQPVMQEGGFGFWCGDWNGDGLDEVLVNDESSVNVLNGDGEPIDRFDGHLIYCFDLVGDSRCEAVILTDIGHDMLMEVVGQSTNAGPSIQTHRTTESMINCSHY